MPDAIFGGAGWMGTKLPKVLNRNFTFKLLIVRDLSSPEAGKSLQKYRLEIFKLLIMRDLSFSGIAKRREKY
jgi:hypothetical protein